MLDCEFVKEWRYAYLVKDGEGRKAFLDKKDYSKSATYSIPKDIFEKAHAKYKKYIDKKSTSSPKISIADSIVSKSSTAAKVITRILDPHTGETIDTELWLPLSYIKEGMIEKQYLDYKLQQLPVPTGFTDPVIELKKQTHIEKDEDSNQPFSIHVDKDIWRPTDSDPFLSRKDFTKIGNPIVINEAERSEHTSEFVLINVIGSRVSSTLDLTDLNCIDEIPSLFKSQIKESRFFTCTFNGDYLFNLQEHSSPASILQLFSN